MEKIKISSEFQEIVNNITAEWPQIQGNGDPNTIDIYFLGEKIYQFLNIKLPKIDLDKKYGIEIVELVESNLIKGKLIRQTISSEIIDYLSSLIEDLKDKIYFKDINDNEKLLISLFMWHGCINMSKLLRTTHVTFSGEQNYDNTLRMNGYNYLGEYLQLNNDLSYWIKYGAKLAKSFSLNRGNSIIEDWIPKDSFYWEE